MRSMMTHPFPRCIAYKKTHRINGTGNACDWHNNAKSWPKCFSKVMLFDSDGNVGAFDPTGSRNMFDL